MDGKEEQEQKRYADEANAAAVCLQLTEPWQNQAPSILIANAWVSGMPTDRGGARASGVVLHH
jgi:hypothetical protein